VGGVPSEITPGHEAHDSSGIMPRALLADGSPPPPPTWYSFPAFDLDAPMPYSGMSTYVVTQDGHVFEVRLGDASGRVVATFSNRLAAERFAEGQQRRDESAGNHPPDGVQR
jgi:hypothetical protein